MHAIGKVMNENSQLPSWEAHISTPNGASTRCHCAVCDQMFFSSMLPSLSMPLPSNHYLLKIHIHLPRNIRYTIPFPIPPERVIQELKVMTNPAQQAFHGKHASTSSTRSQHAASRQDSFTRSNTPAKCSGRPANCSGQSGPGSVCCSSWTASQLLFVFFCAVWSNFCCYRKPTKQQQQKSM